MSSGDDVEPVDQSAAASAGADSYVSLRSENGFIINDQFRKMGDPHRESRRVSDLPRETAETRLVAADDPPLRDLLGDDRYAATCKTQLPGYASSCN